MTKRITAVAGKDELGDPEVFTWDLLPVVDPKATTHLDDNGLPKVGTRITPGMILVGKIGKTLGFDRSRQPTAVELHGLPFNELRSRFGNMWKDGSLYANADTVGIVEQASIENVDGEQVAVVLLKVEAPRRGLPIPVSEERPTVESPLHAE
jgi:DNA-directed RNA polymerase beta subunit